MEAVYFYSTVIIFAILGLCVGSFLNVVIYRLPNGKSLKTPPSHCPNCKKTIAWYDNIPLISYVILGGKCRHCKCKISFQYFFIEALNCIFWLLSALRFYNSGVLYILVVCIFISALICITLIDFNHLFIPDSLQVTLLVCAVINGIINYNNLQSYLLGFLISGGFFLFFYLASFILFNKEGMGFGDVKLMAIAGLTLGIKAMLVAIFIGVIIACVDIVIKRPIANDKNSFPLTQNNGEFAFAPYLSLGLAFGLFFGETIANFYLSFITL